jgi:hypothetical protein
MWKIRERTVGIYTFNVVLTLRVTLTRPSTHTVEKLRYVCANIWFPAPHSTENTLTKWAIPALLCSKFNKHYLIIGIIHAQSTLQPEDSSQVTRVESLVPQMNPLITPPTSLHDSPFQTAAAPSPAVDRTFSKRQPVPHVRLSWRVHCLDGPEWLCLTTKARAHPRGPSPFARTPSIPRPIGPRHALHVPCALPPEHAHYPIPSRKF